MKGDVEIKLALSNILQHENATIQTRTLESQEKVHEEKFIIAASATH